MPHAQAEPIVRRRITSTWNVHAGEAAVDQQHHVKNRLDNPLDGRDLS
jgi:hypothetical protein